MPPLRVIIGILISTTPLIVLGMKNWRAVPLGGLVMAFCFVGALGALSASLGTGAILGFGAALVAIVVAFVVNLRVVDPEPGKSSFWFAASFGAWFAAVFIYLMIANQAVSDWRSKQNAVWYDSLTAKNTRDREAQEKAEAEANRPPAIGPEARTPLLDSIQTAYMPPRSWVLPVQRFVRFGDPIAAPESVTIWVVYGPRYEPTFRESGGMNQSMVEQMRRDLYRGGYPARVAFGFADLDMVTAGGGDRAYFGERGERLLPQFPSDRDTIPTEWRKEFPPPLPRP
jgi:hypothetical protein